MSDTKKQDVELYQTYMQTKHPKDLSALVNQLSPLIYSEVQRASGTLPPQALAAEAKKWTIHAIKNYDASKGAQLSTHVTNYLQKVRRMNYKYQNAARLSENNQLVFHKYNTAQQGLSEQLNREPTDRELADELGWTSKAVTKFKSGIFQDIAESSQEKSTEYSRFDHSKILYDHMMSELSPEEKFIMDNVGEMSSPELAKRLGVNINRLNYLKSKLKTRIQKMQSEADRYV